MPPFSRYNPPDVPISSQMLEETSQEEIDDLADQLQAAQDRIADLEGQIAVLQRQPGGR